MTGPILWLGWSSLSVTINLLITSQTAPFRRALSWLERTNIFTALNSIFYLPLSPSLHFIFGTATEKFFNVALHELLGKLPSITASLASPAFSPALFGAKHGFWASSCQTLGSISVWVTLQQKHFSTFRCKLLRKLHSVTSPNPFTPKSDQLQISPAASSEILHHTVWRTWLFIAHSDERWSYTTNCPPCAFLFRKVGRFLNLGVKGLSPVNAFCSALVGSYSSFSVGGFRFSSRVWCVVTGYVPLYRSTRANPGGLLLMAPLTDVFANHERAVARSACQSSACGWRMREPRLQPKTQPGVGGSRVQDAATRHAAVHDEVRPNRRLFLHQHVSGRQRSSAVRAARVHCESESRGFCGQGWQRVPRTFGKFSRATRRHTDRFAATRCDHKLGLEMFECNTPALRTTSSAVLALSRWTHFGCMHRSEPHEAKFSCRKIF